jgi:aryl-alcohol dehydrogenase-like predicted oxidoreductase
MARRPIPRTGEMLPVIGLGTSDEFESVPEHGDAELKAVVTTLFEQGGTIIDTAPGYGQAEALLGEWLTEFGLKERAFLCSKVSTYDGREVGRASLLRSIARMGKDPVDLLQVHSLRDVATQVANLVELKEAGRVRYIGITTYQATGYDIVEEFIRAGQIDFIQTDYSVVQTLAEQRLIPVAAEHGVAVMVNSAFGNGRYFGALRGQMLPAWAQEFDCESWAQFSLKYILGNPGVTSVLAATSAPAHMLDNARAGMGRLPDAELRRRMVAHMESL